MDIRKIKQLEKEQERQHMRQLETRIMAEKSLVERVRLKLQLKKEVLNEVRGALIPALRIQHFFCTGP